MNRSAGHSEKYVRLRSEHYQWQGGAILAIIISILISGCASNWNYEWKRGTEQQNKYLNGNSKVEKVLRLSVSEPKLRESGAYVVEIKKTVVLSKYLQEQTETFSDDYELRSRNDKKKAVKGVFAAMGGIAGLVAGILIANDYADKKGWNDDDATLTEGYKGLFTMMGAVLVGGIAGGGLGYGVGSVFAIAAPNAKTERTGKTEKRSLHNISKWVLSNETIELFDVPAPGIPVAITGDSLIVKINSQTARQIEFMSDKNGVVEFIIAAASDDWALTKSALANRIRSSKAMQSAKPGVRPALSTYLLEQIRSKSHSLNIATKQSSSPEFSEVENALKTVSVTGYEIPTGSFESACKTFVDRAINKQIREVRIKLLSADMQSALTGARVFYVVDTPVPAALLNKYFDDRIANSLLSQVAGYAYAGVTYQAATNGDGKFSPSLYTPCKLNLRIQHPNCGDVSATVFLTGESDRVTLFLTRNGQVRISNE